MHTRVHERETRERQLSQLADAVAAEPFDSSHARHSLTHQRKPARRLSVHVWPAVPGCVEHSCPQPPSRGDEWHSYSSLKHMRRWTVAEVGNQRVRTTVSCTDCVDGDSCGVVEQPVRKARGSRRWARRSTGRTVVQTCGHTDGTTIGE